MIKYIDAEKLKTLLSELKEEHKQHRGDFHEGVVFAVNEILDDIEESTNYFQQEQQIGEEYVLEIGKHSHIIRIGSQSDIDHLIRQMKQEQPKVDLCEGKST